MFTVDDFVKVVLVLSVCFALVGISVQIIRMLGEFVTTVKFGNKMVKNASTIVEKFTSDYDFLMEQIKMIVGVIRKFVDTVLGPITKGFGFIKSFTGGSSKKGEAEEEE